MLAASAGCTSDDEKSEEAAPSALPSRSVGAEPTLEAKPVPTQATVAKVVGAKLNREQKERLEKQVRFLDAHSDHAAVGAWIEWMDEGGRPLGARKRRPLRAEEIAAERLFRGCLENTTATARTALLRTYRHRERFELSEDFDLWARVAADHKLACLPEVLVRRYPVRLRRFAVRRGSGGAGRWRGGDGAMRLAAPAAVRTGVAVRHLPLGTENLFAREFGMNGSALTLRQAIENGRVVTVDTACANGRTFLLMASVGFDADVVRRVDASRSGHIRHWSYVRPMWQAFRQCEFPEMRFYLDDDQNPRIATVGFLINMPVYGFRLPIAKSAARSPFRNPSNP